MSTEAAPSTDCREALLHDAPAIAAIVNRAYRPEPGTGGWTHESGLVSGPRTDIAQVEALLGQPRACVLVCSVGGRVAGCVLVEQEETEAHIGMLAVDPALQAGGVGRRLLAAAEDLAVRRFGARRFVMSVVAGRSELLAFYLRRGYLASGEVSAYPVDAGVGTPSDPGLALLKLVKPAEAI